jgi:predicted phosphodiesterase
MAVISDIHSNREAFLEVLSDIDRSRVESIVSLGDNIGYGPEPEEVLKLLRQHNIPSTMGNHELGIVDAPRYSSWFNPPTRLSLEITRRLISTPSFEFLKTLRSSTIHCECLCVHGCPPDSVTTYLFSLFGARLQQAFSKMEKDICFVGHTHELELISHDGKTALRSVLTKGVIRLERGLKYIINVGSVGQPRDGDNRAKYVIWDSEDRTLEVRFVTYDIEATIRKILDLGFPAVNAHRLR